MRHARLALVGLLLAFPAVGSARGQQDARDTILTSLRPEHPRLYLTASEWSHLKERVGTDPTAKRWYGQLQKQAARVLKEPPVEHVLIGPRLLDKSRRALDRISLLAGLYRLDGDKAKAERARQELLTVCSFPDWNPSHFLDTAEMSNAVGIGYDWLYDYLSVKDRATIRKALVEMGLNEGLKIYRKNGWWAVAEHNWNQVCNGGLTAGALAIADEEPAVAAEIVSSARKSIVHAMKTFAPDGGWPEGPGYWNYATEYNVFFLSVIESALGTDFGLKAMPGFDRTGGFRIESIGPIGRTFNYADAHDGAGLAPQMFWLARAFDRPEYARQELGLVGERPSIWHLIWLPDPTPEPGPNALPLATVYRGIDVAFLRGDWNDPRTSYVGFKGGDNQANHSHLDLGSFVFDALGQRWAVDLGSDEYNLPGYFGKQRWDYYRLRTESHNTLTIGGPNQDPKARAPLVAFQSQPNRSFAVADLSKAYGKPVREARRGIALLDNERVLVQDEIEATAPVDLAWHFLTKARIEVSGDRASLSLGDAKIHARILEPSGAAFVVVPAEAPRPQAQQADVHDLTIRLAGVRSLRLVVLLDPTESDQIPKSEPLAIWIQAAQ